MTDWTPDINAASGPKYLAIAQSLADAIEAGVLAPGDRLPPQRALADLLGLDLTTVTRAYGEAQRLGLIEGSGRRGSYVKARDKVTPSIFADDPGDTGMNAPPEGFGGTLAQAFRDSVSGLLGADMAAAPFQYQRSGGAPSARRAGAELLTARGISCSEDTVLLAAGGQNALHAIFSAQFKSGDRLAVCAHAYPGLLALARRFGVALQVIASDADGMDPAGLNSACAGGGVRGVYLVPTNDNPTTVTMPDVRRRAIADVIEKHGLLLIEDDAYGWLPDHPLPPITSYVPDQSWHIASVSKVLTPGLRVAWLRAPDVAGAWRLAADMHETAIMAPPLNAAVVTDWIRRGLFHKLIDEVRFEARLRQEIVRECLSPGSYCAQDYGYHLWVEVPQDLDARHVCDALRHHGLPAIPGDAFAAEKSSIRPAAMRVSVGGAIGRDPLRRGLNLLAALIGPQAPRKINLV
ncbi:aminotransferase-like domain-containing protein [Novosphingobium sp. KACC 22771]|uniref:aminotransferase-like domain-containing protein n=1 Tax=Novosphingobium sp. KACC 22771 TaxID=3025670 RepID=UPI002366949E|nr:PLP-dependent aminotransferase family protein [Novosphingobium sp. KACC 22771]WDF74919.1 PLP-dependent aminotransferase family protein [Novosphingobium sp. KACC 22771]